jgi:hypothetical protein
MSKLKTKKIRYWGGKYWVVVDHLGKQVDGRYFTYEEDALAHLKEVQESLEGMEVDL